MSKELEALKIILKWFDDEHLGLDETVKESEEYQTIEKSLKALEIIIQKNVNIKDVKRSIEAEKRENNVKLFPAVGFYNRGQYNEENWLTDNEFGIVREVIL